MSKFTLSLVAVATLAFSAAPALAAKEGTKAREVTFSIVKEKDVTRWDPSVVEVHPGETIQITAKHDLEGGPDFHGLTIAPLNVVKQVNRHKPETFTVTIPKDVKGELAVTCQFHPKHQAAALKVEPAKAK